MPSTINNEASTTYAFAGDPTQLTSESNINTVILQDASGLSLTKVASPTTFAAGEIITYTLTITNNSSSFFTGVRIIDNLGGGNLAYVLGSGNLSTSGTNYPVNPVATNPLTFTLQELNVGQTMTLTYRAQVIFNLPASVTSITNSVQGIGYTSTGTINGFASSTIQKKNSMSLAISKSSSVTNAYPNQVLSYVLTLSNSNSAAATLTNITDQLPANFVVTGITIRIGSGATTTLLESDYTLSGSNLLTVSTVGGSAIVIPANTNAIVTITGYFS